MRVLLVLFAPVGLLRAAELVAPGGPDTTKLSPLADATTTVPVTASAAVALDILLVPSQVGRRGRLLSTVTLRSGSATYELNWQWHMTPIC